MNETEWLFTEVLHCDRLSLYLNKDITLARRLSSVVAGVLKRRVLGEPLQYILGKTEFMGLEFKVDRDVFIPRPETEILVEEAIRVLGRPAGPQARKLRILDIGTGSGCIAVSLARFLPGIQATATDISQEALCAAEENARRHQVEDKIIFLKSDLFAHLDFRPESYDLIVSNPPYIPAGQIKRLSREVRFEPRLALDGGRDGLKFYRRIVRDAAIYLKEKGFLILEMGFNQRGAVEDILADTGDFQILAIIKDYSNLDRVSLAQRK